MGWEQVCREKDKRLLVLLALGTLIMFFDMGSGITHQPVIYNHCWLEIQDQENRLYRFELSKPPVDSLHGVVSEKINIPVIMRDKLFEALQPGQAVGLHEKQGASPVPVSPRLAYFLGQPFSVNSADFDDFTLLPGIGPALAGNIIAYREKYGLITRPSQLEEIPGIGPRMRMTLQNYFTFSPSL